jgi:Uma2 family endonuclease
MSADPVLANVLGKLELNEKGSIELTPSNNRHSLLPFITRELGVQLPEGSTFTECSIETDIGIRVPDVAWASPEFMRRHGLQTPFPGAPEICIEVLSPSNTDVEMREKTEAYLAAGACEVWLVGEDGTIEIRVRSGMLATSRFGIVFALPPT